MPVILDSPSENPMSPRRFAVFAALLVLSPAPFAAGKPPAPADATPAPAAGPWKSETFGGLAWRGIGPALMSGRVADIAVHPTDRATWVIAVASGGLWRTENSGTTWTPVADDTGSYSWGCVTFDPKNPQTVWAGSGENNSQRSVGYGDGVYKSVDGGRTFKNVGLKESEHIGKILVDPRDSSVVYVAAQGPLWKDGGERGLYKTTDGGKSWKAVLTISERTGVTDAVFDPRNPDVLYAAAYQRRRHVWTLINGGPEGAIYKSTDAGASWTKLEKGLPEGDVGRIGLAISETNPDLVYATIEAAGDGSGFYRTTDAGATWEKRSATIAGSPQYYQEIFVDPNNDQRVYLVDVFMLVTEDGGKTFRRAGEKDKHVDNHALWIDPKDSDHLVNGNDGGVYESWDRAATWQYKANLPVTQFYKLGLDNDAPFYHVYGGTQDNATQGGPARTASAAGIANSDWFVTLGGDGFKPAVDPTDPAIVYSQYQHGELYRFDRRNGERIDIQPQTMPGEDPSRWNWDSPLIISPHAHTRLYFASQRVYRSDDRGDSWRAVSGDLTRQIDRNQLPVMGRVYGIDAVAKNNSTSFYGNIVALAESPKSEGLLYAGTDDGLIQVTDDAGGSWRKIDSFPGVPEKSYVSDIEASPFDADTVFAAFDNHKMGDFKPYLLKSTNRGRSWESVAGNLPARGTVYAVALDHVDRDLLFAGTEFGAFFTRDGGKTWIQLKAGLPPIAVRDIEIQRRENDVVLATFGRGFYVLDDYTPLRALEPKALEQPAILFPVDDAWVYVPREPLGDSGKATQGAGYFLAPNPPFGAVFTYYLKDELKTKKALRQDSEKKLQKEGKDTPYPSWDALRAEDREEAPAIVLTVRDQAGQVVRRLTGPVAAGTHRVAWDLRFPAADPTKLEVAGEGTPWDFLPTGPLAAPGRYTVELARRADGALTPLAGPVPFEAKTLGTASLPPADRTALLAFQRDVARLQGAVLGAGEAAGEAQRRIDHLAKALFEAPGADPALRDRARALDADLRAIKEELYGDPVRQREQEPASPGIVDRVQRIVYGTWGSTAAPTGTQRAMFDTAGTLFESTLKKLQKLAEVDLPALERAADAAGAPWTPGRVPRWSR
jgi:photosystem II stability/assembly factor-like uncharacterized protein